jgi:hypothetical protein
VGSPGSSPFAWRESHSRPQKDWGKMFRAAPGWGGGLDAHVGHPPFGARREAGVGGEQILKI